MNKHELLIGFDAKRIVCNSTGLGSYARTLVNDLICRDDGSMKLRLYAPNEGREDLRCQIVDSPYLTFVYPKGNKNVLQRDLWRSHGIVKYLKHDGVKIYHGLSGELPIGLKSAGIKGIVTIHDLIFLRHPEYYNWIDTKIYEWKFKRTCQEADRIIAISECTKHDIMEFGGVNEDKIDLIYQSCSPRFLSKIDEGSMDRVRFQYNLPKRYILTVGSIEERKNVLLVVKALQRLPQDISLVAVGRRTSYTSKVEQYAKVNGLDSRLRILSGVPNTDLAAIYKMAEVFVYPSRYEGFGIPIIEAIGSGLPVVACTGSCLEEAGGPDCLYVSPDDVKGMAEAIEKMFEDAPERCSRIERSKEYIHRFAGLDVASQVTEIYNQISQI